MKLHVLVIISTFTLVPVFIHESSQYFNVEMLVLFIISIGLATFMHTTQLFLNLLRGR